MHQVIKSNQISHCLIIIESMESMKQSAAMFVSFIYGQKKDPIPSCKNHKICRIALET